MEEKNYRHQENFLGNDRHLKKLILALESKDILIWNQFCHSMGTGFKPDLRGIDLAHADLRKANLQKAKLQKANLEGADLRGASLIEAELQGAQLKDALLKETKMKVKVKVSTQGMPSDAYLEAQDPGEKRRNKMRKLEKASKALLEEKKLKEEKEKKELKKSEERRKGVFTLSEDD